MPILIIVLFFLFYTFIKISFRTCNISTIPTESDYYNFILIRNIGNIYYDTYYSKAANINDYLY